MEDEKKVINACDPAEAEQTVPKEEPAASTPGEQINADKENNTPDNKITKKKKKETKKLFGVYVMLSVLLVGVIASTALSLVTLTKVLDLPVAAAGSIIIPDDDEDETRENDVTIGENYVIKATTDISDAYKSGDTSALDDKQKETLDMAAAIVKEVIKDKMTPYEKETAIYDWMTANLSNDEGLLPVIPTTQADCDNPYGVLKYHNAVCVGYATTFRLFMEMLDIPCMVIHDTNLSHSWDLVQLDNDWYHTDIYMDVGSGNYQNFNMNDSIAMTGHDWDTEFFPAADSLKYNIMYQSAKKIKDIFKIPEMLRKAIDDKDTIFSVMLPDNAKEEDAQIAYAMVGYISNSLSYEGSGDFYITPNILNANGKYVVTAAITFYDGESQYTEQFTEEQLQKFADAVNDSFGDLGISFDPSDPTGYDDDYDINTKGVVK